MHLHTAKFQGWGSQRNFWNIGHWSPSAVDKGSNVEFKIVSYLHDQPASGIVNYFSRHRPRCELNFCILLNKPIYFLGIWTATCCRLSYLILKHLYELLPYTQVKPDNHSANSRNGFNDLSNRYNSCFKHKVSHGGLSPIAINKWPRSCLCLPCYNKAEKAANPSYVCNHQDLQKLLCALQRIFWKILFVHLGQFWIASMIPIINFTPLINGLMKHWMNTHL